jgi:hypothetical protein
VLTSWRSQRAGRPKAGLKSPAKHASSCGRGTLDNL